MNFGFDTKRISLSSTAANAATKSFDWVYGLEDMGFTGWEIVCEGNQALSKNNMPDVLKIIETTDLTLTIHLPFSDLNLASLNDPIWNETVRQMKDYIEMASPFARLVVVHPGHLSPLGMQLPDMAWQRNIEGLRVLCDHAAQYNMTIGVENMVNMHFIFGKHAEEMLGMIESVDRDNLGLTFDVGHANTNKAVDIFIEKCIDKIVHVHLHDNNGIRDDHFPAGKGKINWTKVIDRLSRLDVQFVLEARSIDDGKASIDFLRSRVIK